MQLEADHAIRLLHGVSSFNSILVQLEAENPGPYWLRDIEFQFHIGAIRREGRPSLAMNHLSFNSILVQLEADQYSDQTMQWYVFQFHIGAIRRRRATTTSPATTRFQFHIGAIRR